jgi:RNase P/RNase MRP subunit POP5
MKLKTMPSMREKSRYIVFRVHSQQNLSFFDVRNAVNDAILGWLGEKDYALAGTHVIKNLWSSEEMKGYIRCTPAYVDAIKVSLASIRQIGDSRVAFQSVWVSGTIKSAKKRSDR